MRRYVPRIVFGLVIVWIAAIVAIIWRMPPDGTATSAQLAAAYQRALTRHDHDMMARLAPSADDAAVERLLAPPGCPAATPAVVAVVPAGAAAYLDLRSEGTPCGRVPIAQHGRRWVVDAWAAPFGTP